MVGFGSDPKVGIRESEPKTRVANGLSRRRPREQLISERQLIKSRYIF
jgi:hypothetical protein